MGSECTFNFKIVSSLEILNAKSDVFNNSHRTLCLSFHQSIFGLPLKNQLTHIDFHQMHTVFDQTSVCRVIYLKK